MSFNKENYLININLNKFLKNCIYFIFFFTILNFSLLYLSQYFSHVQIKDTNENDLIKFDLLNIFILIFFLSIIFIINKKIFNKEKILIEINKKKVENILKKLIFLSTLFVIINILLKTYIYYENVNYSSFACLNMNFKSIWNNIDEFSPNFFFYKIFSPVSFFFSNLVYIVLFIAIFFDQKKYIFYSCILLVTIFFFIPSKNFILNSLIISTIAYVLKSSIVSKNLTENLIKLLPVIFFFIFIILLQITLNKICLEGNKKYEAAKDTYGYTKTELTQDKKTELTQDKNLNIKSKSEKYIFNYLNVYLTAADLSGKELYILKKKNELKGNFFFFYEIKKTLVKDLNNIIHIEPIKITKKYTETSFPIKSFYRIMSLDFDIYTLLLPIILLLAFYIVIKLMKVSIIFKLFIYLNLFVYIFFFYIGSFIVPIFFILNTRFILFLFFMISLLFFFSKKNYVKKITLLNGR